MTVKITANLLWIFIAGVCAKLPVCLSIGEAAEQIRQTHLSCGVSVCFDVGEAWREASLVSTLQHMQAQKHAWVHRRLHKHFVSPSPIGLNYCVCVMRTETLANTYISSSGLKWSGSDQQCYRQVMDLNRWTERRMESDAEPKGQLLGARQDNIPDGLPFVSVCIHTDPFSSWQRGPTVIYHSVRLSVCQLFRVMPPAAGGSSVEWPAMARYWAHGAGCVSSVGFI